MAKSIGVQGMVGGQVLDLMAEHEALTIPEITRLQRLKTGMLIGYSCESGAILGKAPMPARQALHNYAHDLGLAFQIVDDLLDVEGDEQVVGKKTHKDGEAGKATFVSLLGVERARSQATMLADQAVAHLELFQDKADPLERPRALRDQPARPDTGGTHLVPKRRQRTWTLAEETEPVHCYWTRSATPPTSAATPWRS